MDPKCVERAKELLRSKPASLAEVGMSTGFGSQSHFTSTFHHAVGATPAEFQRLVAKTPSNPQANAEEPLAMNDEDDYDDWTDRSEK